MEADSAAADNSASAKTVNTTAESGLPPNTPKDPLNEVDRGQAEEDLVIIETEKKPAKKIKRKIGKMWAVDKTEEDDFQKLLDNYQTNKRPRNNSGSSDCLNNEVVVDSTAEPICRPEEVGSPFGRELETFDVRKSNFRAQVVQKYDNPDLDKAMGVSVSTI